MLSYQVLDRVADSHNPVLGIIWLSLSAAPFASRQWRKALSRFIAGLACLLVAYGLMWVDSITQLWGQLSLDYSSHTAVAVALLGAICASSRRLGFLAAALIGLYVPLMIYQGYHSLADIASTALAVGGPCVGIGVCG